VTILDFGFWILDLGCELMTEMDYPLGDNARDRVKAASGRRLSDITLEAVAAGEVNFNDLQVSAETLRAQARIARQAGYPQLAGNLSRAAELTAVPNDELLRMYEALRPGRSTYAEMIALATRLEQVYGAVETGRLAREAAEVYLQRGLLMTDDRRQMTDDRQQTTDDR